MKNGMCVLTSVFILALCGCATHDLNTENTSIIDNVDQLEEKTMVVSDISDTEQTDTVDDIKKETDFISSDEINVNQSTDSKTKQTLEQNIYGIWHYNGYLDECFQWSAYENFVNCDYDEDGLTDRVYRVFDEKQMGEYSDYIIEFGNGKKIQILGTTYTGFPVIQSGDLDADNENEILFSQEYWTSTDPSAFGNMVLFDFVNGKYEEVLLPLADNNDAHGNYNPCLTLEYKVPREQTILVKVHQNGFEQEVYIEDVEIWDQYKQYYDEVISPAAIYNVILKEDGKQKYLSCSVEVFDRWYFHEIKFDIVYNDGNYIIQNMELL